MARTKKTAAIVEQQEKRDEVCENAKEKAK